MKKTPKKGRKPKSEADRKSQVYQVRLSPSDHAKLHQRADAAGQTVAAFLRDRALA